MQQTIQNWSAPSVSPVWFDESKFESKSFNCEQYVDDLKRYVPMETLKTILLEYAEEMRGKLVELVNEDYDEFAALSTKLVNVEAAISDLEGPMLAVKEEIERVRHKLVGHSTSLKEAIQRRQAAAELRTSLELAKDAVQSLSNVQKLAQSLQDDGAMSRRSSSSSVYQEDLCKNLDRICSELGRVLYILQSNKNVASIANIHDKVEAIRSVVESNLNDALIQVLNEQDPSSLGTLLHAYSTIGNSSTPEEIVRLHVIVPFIQSTKQSDAYNQESASGLLTYMSQAMKVEVWPFLEVATSMCSSSLPYDFPGQSVLPEVMAFLEAKHPTMYSSGNPKEFQTIYLALQMFLEDLERLCVNQDQVIRFRNSAAYKVNHEKWNFAAYFSLCFQEIASVYERKLPNVENLLASTDMCDASGQTHVRDCVESIESCLDEELFVQPIFDKLVRLQLQIVYRFIDWVDQVAVCAKENADLSKDAPVFVARLFGSICTASIADKAVEKISTKISEPELLDKIRGSFVESEVALKDKAEDLLRVCADGIAERCSEYLGQIRGIVAAFRMTARTPTTAAQYSSMILKPLETFLSDLAGMEGLDRLSRAVIAKVCERYHTVARDTLETARKTEESLKKLKSRKTNSNGVEESTGLSTDQMVALQLSHDVKEFVSKIGALLSVTQEVVFDELPAARKLFESIVE